MDDDIAKRNYLLNTIKTEGFKNKVYMYYFYSAFILDARGQYAVSGFGHA